MLQYPQNGKAIPQNGQPCQLKRDKACSSPRLFCRNGAQLQPRTSLGRDGGTWNVSRVRVKAWRSTWHQNSTNRQATSGLYPSLSPSMDSFDGDGRERGTNEIEQERLLSRQARNPSRTVSCCYHASGVVCSSNCGYLLALSPTQLRLCINHLRMALAPSQYPTVPDMAHKGQTWPLHPLNHLQCATVLHRLAPLHCTSYCPFVLHLAQPAGQRTHKAVRPLRPFGQQFAETGLNKPISHPIPLQF